jgi:hypothetical protein
MTNMRSVCAGQVVAQLVVVVVVELIRDVVAEEVAKKGGVRGRKPSNSQVSNHYYSNGEWTALSFDEKQAVQYKQSLRDQRRGVQVVQQQQHANKDRRVQQQTDTEQISETNSANNTRLVSVVGTVVVGTVARGTGIGP